MLKSTLTGTIVWVVHWCRLTAVPVPVMSMQLSMVEPATMGWPLRSMPLAGMPARTRTVERKPGGAVP